MSKKFFLACFFTLFLITAAGVGAFAAEFYMVVADIGATVEKPGLTYKIDHGVIEYSEALKSPLVYGNIVNAVPIKAGEFANSWLEVKGGARFDEENKSIGYVSIAALAPMPDVNYFPAPEPCRFAIDSPDLFLLPGSFPILDYTLPDDEPYHVLAGEVTDGLGSFKDATGQGWTLLRFNTKWNTKFGFRYAWTRSENVKRLSLYEPDHSKVDPALVPRMVRDLGSIEDRFYQSLLLNGFALDAAPIIHTRLELDDLVDSYPDSDFFTPNFVTTDLFLHVFHLVFSRSLKRIEEFNFAPALENMLVEAVIKLNELESKSGNSVKVTFDDARDFLTIPAILVRPVPELIGALQPSLRAQREVSLILNAEIMGLSDISGKVEDYTFYTPRGHYTSTEELSNYFRAMAYLGGMSIPLSTGDQERDRRNIAMTALLCFLFEDESLRNKWDSLYEPLTYMIGAVDDPTIRDYGPVAGNILNGSLDKLADADALNELREAFIAATPAPRIIDIQTGNVSQEEREEKAAGLCLMGRRFVLDAWVFGQLTSPNVGNGEAPRNLPKTADIMAALGSNVADEALDIDRQNIPKYAAALENVKKEVYSFFETWDGTLVSAWLGTLGLYLTDKDSKQFFWNTPLWESKKLLTASASWAELKHDTVLYAKQNYAEMGGSGEWVSEPFGNPMPVGYVEPSPRTFDAIAVALSRLLEIVEKYGLEGSGPDDDFGGNAKARIEALLAIVETYRDIARKEVDEEPLNHDDYLAIRYINTYLNSNLLLDPTYVEDENSSQLRMAFVTDASTDAFEERVLQAGTGTPRRIYVFVNDKWGGPRVTIGYTYSFYEFPRFIFEGRMTDEEWRELVYDETRQVELEQYAPEWSGNLFVW